jgi:hypothetical protein
MVLRLAVTVKGAAVSRMKMGWLLGGAGVAAMAAWLANRMSASMDTDFRSAQTDAGHR